MLKLIFALIVAGIALAVLRFLFYLIVSVFAAKSASQQYSASFPSSLNRSTGSSQSSIIAELLNILDREFEELDFLGTNALKEQCKSAILEHAAEYERGIRSGKPARIVILFLILNLGSGMLETGMFHVYRGVLGIEGEGMLDMCNAAAEKLANDGYITQPDLEECKANLLANIETVG